MAHGRKQTILLGLAVLMVFFVHPTNGQLWSERLIPPPPDVTADGLFGWSVSIEDDLMLVGAPGSTDLGIQSGAAYLFQRNNGGLEQWDLLMKLVPEGLTPGARFGTHVLLKDDRAFVGAPLDLVNGVIFGSLFVFDRNAGGADNWGLTQRIFATEGSLGMQFGTTFSVGEILVVGAPLYDAMGGPNTTGGIATFVPNDDGFYSFVDLYHRQVNNLSLSAFALFNDAFYTGRSSDDQCLSVRIDSLITGDTQQFTLLPITGSLPISESFGLPVGSTGLAFATSVNRMIIAASTASFHQVHSYIIVADSVVQEGAVLPDTLLYNATNRFGEALALEGERMVVGAPGDPIGTPLGFVGVFDHNESAIGQWSPMLKLVPSDPEFGDLFGRAVALAGASVAVGAPGKGADDRGQVYVYNDPFASVPEHGSTAFSVAPVPADDLLVIRVEQDHAAAYDLRLLDALGRPQAFGSLRNGRLDLDVTHLSDGVYVALLTDDRSHVAGSRRLVITHH